MMSERLSAFSYTYTYLYVWVDVIHINNDICILECECNEEGSKTLQCSEDGKCNCKLGFDGDKCEICAKGFYNSFSKCKSKYLITFPITFFNSNIIF